MDILKEERRLTKVFAEADKDKNHKLSKDELRQGKYFHCKKIKHFI